MAAPSVLDIEATVERMEQRYRQSSQFAAYLVLCQTFAHDLEDRRDLALAKSAALMMVKQLSLE